MSKIEFESLVTQYSRQVLTMALRIVGNSAMANDVHQEVFLAIWRRWHKYDGKTNWQPYLYRATVRKAIELAKHSRPEQLTEQPAKPQAPDGPIRTAELQRRLAKCLGKLPRRQADVFVLARIEGLPHAEIAQMLGCSEKTVRVHLHRATKKLAAQFSDYLE